MRYIFRNGDASSLEDAGMPDDTVRMYITPEEAQQMVGALQQYIADYSEYAPEDRFVTLEGVRVTRCEDGEWDGNCVGHSESVAGVC